MIRSTQRRVSRTSALLAAGAAVFSSLQTMEAAPVVTRLTPPSMLFSFNDAGGPITARFLPDQRFDLQAVIQPDSGQSIVSVQFEVDNAVVSGGVTLSSASGGRVAATRRAYSSLTPGVHTLRVTANQSDGGVATAEGNFEVVPIAQVGRRAKNIIIMIGDGLGIQHRSAARIMLNGVQQGKVNAPLAMDTFPFTGLVQTASLNSIITDSSPGAACYSTGNKSNNNQHGVFPDDTNPVSGDGSANFDNPRVELIGEYLARTQGKSLGIVTTSDVFDATPASFGSHTQSRGAGTGIVDQYFDDRNLSGLTVLLGGGRKWFLPNSTAGSARTAGTDYTLPADLVAAWGANGGALDPNRDLLGEFQAAGYTYAADRARLQAVPAGTSRLLGLFSLSNMNVALDKIDGRRGTSTVVNDYGFPDQPMLEEMTEKALQVLSTNTRGFVLMVEGASIDKQAHNMDTERWILDTIEFDRSVQKAKDFAAANPDTLVVITADHECAGVAIIGGSLVSNANLQTRASSGGGAAQLRSGVVGTYESAGFPNYTIAGDGYPTTTDVDNRMLIGYAANADRYEDWLTNPRPLRDSQQPFNNTAPLNTYPSGPLNRDTAGNFLVTGQISDAVAAHTGGDVPLSASGRGSSLFSGTYDNTDVFFKVMQAAVGGAR